MKESDLIERMHGRLQKQREKQRKKRNALREKEHKKKLILREKTDNKRKALKEKERKKNQLLKAAITLFEKKGYEKTHVEEITIKANVAKGTFYNFFEHKEDIFSYFLKRAIELSNKEIDKKITTTNDFFKQLKILISIYMKHFFQNKHFAKVLFTHRVLRAKADQENEKVMIYSLTKLVEMAKQSNQIKSEIETKKIVEIIFAINTLYVMYFIDGTIQTPQELYEEIINSTGIFCAGIVLNGGVRTEESGLHS